MNKLIFKKFVSHNKDTSDPKVRSKYGALAGVLGIVCNTILFLVKVIVGILTVNSAIISDAFNNLSDMGSSVVSFLSSKLANKKPDREHPFGHARLEYVATFIVSFLIVFMGLEIIINSSIHLSDILQDKKEFEIQLNYTLLGILGIFVFVKIWMATYNFYFGRMIKSSILKATALDSLYDAILSFLIIISTIIGATYFPKFPITDCLSIVVGIFIFVSGIKMMINAISDLLGRPASKEVIESIKKIIVSKEGIYGVHDLIVHDYGPSRKMASAHVEVKEDANVVSIHQIVDEIEKEVLEKLHIPLVLHIDPIDITSKKINELRETITETINTFKHELTFHDLRIISHNGQQKVIFDLVVPFEDSVEENKYVEKLKSSISQLNPFYQNIEINIDHD